jgi:hypothetical protein
MHQYAWLELHEGMWHLLTDVRSKHNEVSRKWVDKDIAITELIQDGWSITGPYPLTRASAANSATQGHAGRL